MGCVQHSFGSSHFIDERTFTETLFQDNFNRTVFTCKILSQLKPNDKSNLPAYNAIDSENKRLKLTVRSYGDEPYTYTKAEVIHIYFGKIDSNIVTIVSKGHNPVDFEIGNSYLIYTYGGKTVNCRGIDVFNETKSIVDDPDSSDEIHVIKQFSDVFKAKATCNFVVKNSKGFVLAQGKYKNGQAVGLWKHYYDSGSIKAEYNLKRSITTQFYPNGFIKTKFSIKGKEETYEYYTDKFQGRLTKREIQTKMDTGIAVLFYIYFPNGNLNKVEGRVDVYVKGGGMNFGWNTNIYEEYYENGKPKIKGRYDHNKKVGKWKEFTENGELRSQIDYKSGTAIK